ncbi:MAG: reprolysin-like metallopeptidase, partial [Thermoanaerobaculia bacterium]
MKNERLSFFLVLSFLAATASASVSNDGLWRSVGEETILASGGGERVLFPRRYRTVALKVDVMRGVLDHAPLELTTAARAAAPVITLPLPDGSYGRFAIQESPIVDAELASQLPDVKTYRAEGIDDPAATARLDLTPAGFHGFILSPSGTVYIDPYRRGDTQHYLSYWRRDYARPDGATPFECDFADVNPPKSEEAAVTHGVPAAARGAMIRTYRIAMACTGEYAAYHGGTVAAAQAAMVTTMNRINGIYEKEVAVRMTMVNNASITFTNSITDPYANTSTDLAANQVVIDANIGNANYDIGHLVGTGGGGVAYLGVVCETGWKAQGLTGSSSPVGDAFDVDYVAHEIGHQFGATHTFNGTTSSCGGGNREPSSAYEPGSGTTIMAYAGICGSEDLQPHSDPYFHTKSFDEIVAFTGAISCAVQTPSGNAPPFPSAGAAITIPAATPFYLTATATDADGDPLTYCWEEFDLGAASPPNTDNGNRAIFRSFNPVTSPIRMFPKLSDILGNTSTFGESLPTTTRTMTFRVTARDNITGANVASTTVNVSSAAGPFTVTAPNTTVSWTGGSAQTVTWNVAGTTAAPVSCTNVKILLSTDGGNTFPTTVLASTPNDGTQGITVPNATTATARIRVECVTSPFFDVSNVNFSISTSVPVVATAASGTSIGIFWSAVAGATSYEVYRRAAGGSFALIGTTASTSFTDNLAVAGSAYLYAAKSVSGAVTSALGTPDLATAVIFTDPTLAAAMTIRRLHVHELRTAINAVRTLAGLSAFSFTDPTITAGTTVVKAAHVNEARTALDAARSALTLSAVSYTDPALPAAV